MRSCFHLAQLTASLFYICLLAILILFFWTRVNTSDHLYFIGDGNVIVALIEEMLRSGNWTADIGRIAHTFSLQSEWQPFSADLPKPGEHYFNLAGYTVVGTLVCNIAQSLGLTLSIPFLLHGFNVILQGLTLLLLYRIGRFLAGPSLGLLCMLFFVCLPLAVTEAHYERPESWLAFLTAIVLFTVLKYAQAPKRSMLAMGLALGFSLAVKFSQLFLGMIPFIIIIAVLCSPVHSHLMSRIRKVSTESGICLLGMGAALWMNIPFMFNYLPEYFGEITTLSSFYDSPHPLYATEHYSYLSQMGRISDYFLSTLGIGWCLLLIAGILLCFTGIEPLNIDPLHLSPGYFRLALCTPVLFIFFYFSLKYNFFERVFSSTEPMLAILSACSVYAIWQAASHYLKKNGAVILCILLLIAIVLYKPVTLNYQFIQYHIRQPGHQERIEFQETLKKDFPRFWFKNVHMTVGFDGAIPENPGKAPRLYHLEDFNQYWTAPHFRKLEENGFIHVGTYCSRFHQLPVSNHTVYHAAAKNHYWVRRDEWPMAVPRNYFLTNCQ